MEEKEIIKIIKESFTMNSICKKVFGYSNKGAIEKIKKIIDKYDINIEHFSLSKSLQKYEIVKKTCPVCNTKFDVKKGIKKEKTTCSRSCSSKYFHHGVNNSNFDSSKYNLKKEKISESIKKLKSKFFTEEEIKRIKDLYNELKSTRKVAKELGISREYIRKYVDIFIPIKLSNEQIKINNYKRTYSWKKEAKKLLVEYKGGKCINCGYSNCVESLDFHHLDSKEKDFNISGKSYSLERLKNEVDKCVLLCSNCHREFHAGYIKI
jgi:hypothetical protein